MTNEKNLSGSEDDPESSPSIRLFVVEDHKKLLEALSVFFEMQADMTFCGSAESGEQALEEIEKCNPNVVCADLSLPNMSGIELISQIRQKHPKIKCMILTSHKEPAYAEKARQAGADGFVLKGNPGAVADSVRKVAAGGDCFVSMSLD